MTMKKSLGNILIDNYITRSILQILLVFVMIGWLIYTILNLYLVTNLLENLSFDKYYIYIFAKVSIIIFTMAYLITSIFIFLWLQDQLRKRDNNEETNKFEWKNNR